MRGRVCPVPQAKKPVKPYVMPVTMSPAAATPSSMLGSALRAAHIHDRGNERARPGPRPGQRYADEDGEAEELITVHLVPLALSPGLKPRGEAAQPLAFTRHPGEYGPDKQYYERHGQHIAQHAHPHGVERVEAEADAERYGPAQLNDGDHRHDKRDEVRAQVLAREGVYDIVRHSSAFFRYSPVALAAHSAQPSGVPSKTISPPPSPPSGPRSMMWSATFMTSRLCSMTTTVLPASARRSRMFMSFLHVGGVQAGRGARRGRRPSGPWSAY